MSTEEWRPILGYEGGYEVSDLGRIRIIKTKRFGQLLSTTHADNAGYHFVRLWRDAEPKTLRVHRIVLEAFSGPRPPRMVARHLNGDNTDNRLENLAWGTQSENQYDAVRHGTHSLASRVRCKNDHPLDSENTILNRSKEGSIHRRCRTCHYEAVRRYKAKRARATVRESEVAA